MHEKISKFLKTLAPGDIKMYRKSNSAQQVFDFYLPFGGKLNPKNRWIIMSEQIPWEEIEEEYFEHFSRNQTGNPALPVRVALGALIIKERLGITDRETVEQIRENPYLQYFLGLGGYSDKEPFHHTTMVHFRRRLNKEILSKVNAKMVFKFLKQNSEEKGTSNTDPSFDDGDIESKEGGKKPESSLEDTPPENKGKLLVDATCTPADISYPNANNWDMLLVT